jgi:ATP-binding cassette subfamily B protein
MRTDRSALDRKIGRETFRRVLEFAKPQRRRIGVFLALTVVDAGLVVVNPLLVARIVDRGIIAGSVRVVVTIAMIMTGVAAFNAGLGVIQGYLSSRIGESLIFDLRTTVFAHVQRMSLAFFTRTQTGALVSRLNNDVMGAQRAFTSTLSSTVSNAISAVVVGAAMFILSWQITLAVIAMFPLLLLVSRWVGSRLAGLTRQQMEGNAALGNAMTERFNIAGAMLLKLFGRREEEDVQFAEKVAVVRDLGVQIALVTRIFAASLGFVPAIATAFVYGVGGYLAVQQHLTVGTVLALATLLTRMLGPLQGLSNVRVDVLTALVSFERVFEVLDLKSLVQERPDAVELPASAASVEFVGVHFSYPSPEDVSLASLEVVAREIAPDTGEVLHGVSFRADPGEMVALVGPSGAGKTTLTHLVARLYDVTDGAVRVGDSDVREVTLESLEACVGYVTQDAHMFHDSIRENLLYARPTASESEIWDALEAAQIRKLVEGLPNRLDTVVGDRGYRLSGGERQRLAIARLLLKAPSIVVLDEATAHLDSDSEVAVQRALDTALEGRTSLVIAHRLSTIRNADRIVVLDQGRVVQTGTHAELLAEGGLYGDLYRTQFATT